MKTEVYSWRVSPETKSALEEMARRSHSNVSELLDRIVAEWLSSRTGLEEDDAEQQRLHELAAATIGTIQGSNPRRAARASALVRERLTRQRANQGAR